MAKRRRLRWYPTHRPEQLKKMWHRLRVRPHGSLSMDHSLTPVLTTTRLDVCGRIHFAPPLAGCWKSETGNR